MMLVLSFIITNFSTVLLSRQEESAGKIHPSAFWCAHAYRSIGNFSRMFVARASLYEGLRERMNVSPIYAMYRFLDILITS
jgi:hypothetical protein